MRKKLFAVIMSAMMMVTFMPAMAFAAEYDADGGKTTNGWNVAGKIGYFQPDYWVGDTVQFTYDGQSHEVTYTPSTETGKTKVVSYDWSYSQSGKTVYTRKTATAPVVKDAGAYEIIATVESYEGLKSVKTYKRYLNVYVWARLVKVTGAKTLLASKVYDGKGYVIDDKSFVISGIAKGTNCSVEIPGSKETETVTVTDEALTGLVAGDTLFTKAFETKADAATYVVDFNVLKSGLNSNYALANSDLGGITGFTAVTIEKADPAVKITSNTLTIKRGSFKAVKYSTNLGKAKLTKTSGNAKITLKNGKLYVKKGLKKGTYKVTVKAEVTKDINWNAASRTKTLKIKVK